MMRKKFMMMGISSLSLVLLAACATTSNKNLTSSSLLREKLAAKTSKKTMTGDGISPQNVQDKIDLNQIASNDFSSLVGTWRNLTDGTVIVVTSQTTSPNPDSSVNPKVSLGAVVSGYDRNGYPGVIIPGDIKNGYMAAGFGTFDPSVKVSPFLPLIIVPKGTSVSSLDRSDRAKDRLILDGSQENKSNARTFYREN